MKKIKINKEISVTKTNETFVLECGDYSIQAITCIEEKRLDISTYERENAFIFSTSTPETVKSIGKLLLAASCLLPDDEEEGL